MAFAWFVLTDSDNEAAGAPSRTEAWQTVQSGGVEVDIPASWQLRDMSGCEVRFANVWAPSNVSGCSWAGGLAFYNSATFDPASGPGVQRVNSADEPDWGGYTTVGAVVVYTSDNSQEVVRRILDSAR